MENSKKGTIVELPTSANISKLNCIDLSSSDIQNSASHLKQACMDHGFFYVINHRISQEFMDEVFEQSKKFFAMPLEEKKKLLKTAKGTGYTPIHEEQLDPVNQKQGDHKEAYDIIKEVSEDGPEGEKPFQGINAWPAEDMLPGFRETMQRFDREALGVARAVARIMAFALDLDSNFFDEPEVLGNPSTVLRLLYYEGQISDPTKELYGAGAHTDLGMFTLLATDEVTGLQICKDKDAKPQVWEYIAPLKGAFIVNIGDVLERWSNGKLRSTLHRVLGNGQERYSIGFFVSSSFNHVIECLPTCQSAYNPPKFPPIKNGDFMLKRYTELHFKGNEHYIKGSY